MTTQRTASSHFDLPISAADAIHFFTPEGERSWAPGWDPTYPAGDISEDPGTVFVTTHDDAETVWIIDKIDRAAHTSAYSLVKIGHRAGTVRVRCADKPDGGSRIHVAYAMTLLPTGPKEELDAFSDDHFATMMVHWRAFVTADLENQKQA